MFPYVKLSLFYSIEAFDVYHVLGRGCGSPTASVETFPVSYLPVDPDVAVVQLREFSRICCFTHTATFFL